MSNSPDKKNPSHESSFGEVEFLFDKEFSSHKSSNYNSPNKKNFNSSEVYIPPNSPLNKELQTSSKSQTSPQSNSSNSQQNSSRSRSSPLHSYTSSPPYENQNYSNQSSSPNQNQYSKKNSYQKKDNSNYAYYPKNQSQNQNSPSFKSSPKNNSYSKAYYNHGMTVYYPQGNPYHSNSSSPQKENQPNINIEDNSHIQNTSQNSNTENTKNSANNINSNANNLDNNNINNNINSNINNNINDNINSNNNTMNNNNINQEIYGKKEASTNNEQYHLAEKPTKYQPIKIIKSHNSPQDQAMPLNKTDECIQCDLIEQQKKIEIFPKIDPANLMQFNPKPISSVIREKSSSHFSIATSQIFDMPATKMQIMTNKPPSESVYIRTRMRT